MGFINVPYMFIYIYIYINMFPHISIFVLPVGFSCLFIVSLISSLHFVKIDYKSLEILNKVML